MLFFERIMVKLISILRGVPNKREFLARAFGRLGLLSLLERIIARRRPGLVVLTYHRIAESRADLFYDPVISATPEAFRAQIEWISNHVRLLTLDQLVAQVKSGTPWHEPSLLLTFDDGYRDNFHQAVPILRERSAPATFFVPTAFLDSPRLPWWDQVAYAVKQTCVHRLTLKRNLIGSPPPLEIDLQTVSRHAAIMTIIRAFLDDSITNERWFLDQLADQAKVNIDSERLGRDLFMTWDHLRQMADSGAGLSIGSHAHSHRKLAGLGDDTQRHELADSKQILETRLGRPVKALAYPYGWAGAYTVGTKALAARAGYCLAFSSREGINQLVGFDRYDVSRLGIGSADSAALIRARSTLHATFGKSFL
jgi:peptidoglycan/xylan/chitin deacetylase (PgdA/CDA1 family)